MITLLVRPPDNEDTLATMVALYPQAFAAAAAANSPSGRALRTWAAATGLNHFRFHLDSGIKAAAIPVH
jgi:hypothetical protein